MTGHDVHAAEQFDREMYLEIMREDPPLKRYVSRGDTPDDVDIPGPHQDADRAIFRAIRFTMSDGTPRLQPVLGDAGMGKTHLFWVIKGQEDLFSKGQFLAVYVPSPPAPVRVPLHFHACIVDEAGDQLFEETVDMLITKFGGLKGVTHEIYDYTYAMERLLVEYPGISADVVKALLRYRLDPATRDLARRWLLGDALSDEETSRLGVRTVLEDDDVTLATIKLLSEGSERTLVLFVDEMEGPYNTYGEEGERHFFEVLKRLYNECKNVVIVASSLKEIWKRIYAIADAPMRSRMEAPVELRHFTCEDIAAFVRESMLAYWRSQNVAPPPDPLFPLTDEDIDAAFEHSRGVPREAIRFIIPRLEAILYERAEEPAPQEDYVIKLTATVVMSAIEQALSHVAAGMGAEIGLVMATGGTQKQSAAVLRVEKDGVEKMLGIDVPNVKDWNRSGGVAAFYSAKRLKKALDEGLVSLAVLAVPRGTKGTKFEAMCRELGDSLVVLEFNEESATRLVRSLNEGQLDDESAGPFKRVLQAVLST